MRLVLHGAFGLVLLAGLSAPRIAAAVPISYFFTSGSAFITVSAGPTTLLSVPNQPLTGDHVTFDSATPELTDIQLEINAAGPFALSAAYAGYDTVTLANAVLSPAAGFTGPANLELAGPPVDNYSFASGPVKVTGTLTATDSTLTLLPLVSNFNILNPAANGTLFVNTVTGNISIMGVTIAVVPPSGGETYPLVIKGDFFFHGVIPEPATALLLGSGMVGLLALGRRVRG